MRLHRRSEAVQGFCPGAPTASHEKLSAGCPPNSSLYAFSILISILQALYAKNPAQFTGLRPPAVHNCQQSTVALQALYSRYPVCRFTRFSIGCPAKYRSRLSANSPTIFSSVSGREKPPETCGVIKRFGAFQSPDGLPEAAPDL